MPTETQFNWKQIYVPITVKRTKESVEILDLVAKAQKRREERIKKYLTKSFYSK